MPVSADSPLHAVASDIVAAAEEPNAVEAIMNVLRDYANRFHPQDALVHEEADDEVLLYSGPTLTIYHITLSPGLQYPAHNHLMDAIIGIYKGSESNFVYPAARPGELGPADRQDIAAPAVVHLPSNTVHAVANAGSTRSGAIHVYLGDLVRTSRQLWDLDSGGAEPFDNDRYLAGARPLGQPVSRGQGAASAVVNALIEDAAEVEQKLIALAEATPEDCWNWRPVEAVRSIREVFMHVAADNYFLPAMADVAAPAATGIRGDEAPIAFESQTLDKAATIVALRTSFDHLESAMRGVSLDAEVSFFGNSISGLRLWVITVTHMHEQLGQMITYARSNGIVPPWSRGN